MEKRSYSSKVKSYLRFNWFKLTILGMLIFVFLRKDLSFQFNINSPSQLEQVTPAEQPQKTNKKEKEELLTQKKVSPKTSNTSLLSTVDIPLFGDNEQGLNLQQELAGIDLATQKKYVKRFAHVAVSESKKYGIPASIILANAVLHSMYGQRDLAQAGNNHFGIPCTNKWLGESGTYNDACYRHYENAWSSFRDHSLYLTSGTYAELRQIPANDYKTWAKALERMSYSDVYDNLADQLINLIERAELHTFDMG